MSIASKFRRRLAVSSIAAIFAAACSIAASADTLTGVVEEAIATNPEIGAIKFNRRAIDHELQAARGLQLPTLDVRSELGRHRNTETTALGIQDNNDWHDHRFIQGVATQRIFDGFEARHEIARQKNRVESARWRVNDTANSVALRAVQSYLELQRAASVLRSAEANLNTLQSLQSRINARVDGGVGKASDATEAGARVANAIAIVAEANNRLRDADALFRAVVGRAPGKLDAVNVPRSALPTSVEAAVGEALAAAPSIIATHFDATAAHAAVGSAYSRFSPKLNFELTGDAARGDQEDGDRNSDVRAMLVVRWNLINGGIDKARVYEARARAMEAEEISANTERIIERETRVSWNAMLAASERIPALTRELELNRQRRASYREQFEAGQRLLLDLLNVQNEIFIAEASLRTEELVAKFNAYRILAAMGRLVPTLGLSLPEEAINSYDPTLVDSWRKAPAFIDPDWRERWHTTGIEASQPTK